MDVSDSTAGVVTREPAHGSPPSYCADCRELFATPDTQSINVQCPSCGQWVRAAVGRFSGIANVVRFVADLTPSRRTALQGALQPGKQTAVDSPETALEARWLTDWLSRHDVATSSFWRGCLLLATQLVPPDEQLLTEAQVAAIARDVAYRAGASQSFMPRHY
jgi:ribosomal protein S27E